jgi:PAS domain S-box-containing protein
MLGQEALDGGAATLRSDEAPMGDPAALGDLSLLGDLAQVAYFRVDADRNLVEVSPAMERVTGFAPDEVLGRSCLTLHRCQECLKGCGVFEHRSVIDRELELFRKDGTSVRVRKSGKLLRDEHGEITGALEVVWMAEPEGHEEQKAEAEERDRIESALLHAKYHRGEAAKALGMSRTTLWRKMREFGL